MDKMLQYVVAEQLTDVFHTVKYLAGYVISGAVGALPKSKSSRSGVSALLRSVERLRKMNDPRFTEARPLPHESFEQPIVI
jgi:hypothetical protein